jgi:hypothetical protein
MTGLFAGFPGARRWRQLLSPPHRQLARASDLLKTALDTLPDWVLDSTELRPTPREPAMVPVNSAETSS